MAAWQEEELGKQQKGLGGSEAETSSSHGKCQGLPEQRAGALAPGADGTARELEKLISRTTESSKLQEGCEDLPKRQPGQPRRTGAVRRERALGLGAAPGREGAWGLSMEPFPWRNPS